jgi:hypothetical protein
VAARAPEGHPHARSGLTTLCFSHGSCANTAATDCTATGHDSCLSIGEEM